MFAVGDIQIGNFIIRVSTCEIDPPPFQGPIQRLHKEYYLVLVTEVKQDTEYYISFTKDPRFVDFKPRSPAEDESSPEHDWYTNCSNSQMPMWKLSKDNVAKLFKLCEGLCKLNMN